MRDLPQAGPRFDPLSKRTPEAPCVRRRSNAEDAKENRVSKQEAGKPRADDTQAHAGLANEIRGTVGEVCGGASTARIDIHHHELERPGECRPAM